MALALFVAPVAMAQDVAAPVAVTSRAAAPAAAPAVASEARPRHHRTKGDPLEGFNRTMFSIHQFLDRIAFRPLAMLYKTVVPKPLRTGIRHVFSNVGEPLVFANDMLQLKPKRAIKTVGRFLVNSTIGIGGVLDVAKTREFNLPHHDNSFGTTLGHYGLGPGPYIFLPLVGPSDFRDFGAGIAQGQTYAFTIGTPFDRAEYRVSEAVLTGLDLRVESDGALKALLGGAIDPYATLRSAYLQDRAVSIAESHGAKAAAASALDDPLTDPAADPLVDPAAGAAPASATPAAKPDDFPADPAAAPTPPSAEKTPVDDFPADPAAPVNPTPSVPPAPATTAVQR
ncbi:VacJ family lipoprotein [Sphingomonas sp. AAP5]|uniref:MlaA family lipoprotein n=1 Tax=unclassified Sphingomonas TaxID=196159 RepID=UPI001057231D|nr:VacJ family lipoprotein [Sphingomonas sp. AAP5]QBM76309.1 VacJ family lipoprotein [Sphingomonas sp. AAP5]